MILGDEMGLGKTAQSLSLLHTVSQMEGVQGPFLIVAPLSTLPHWERELAMWTNMYGVTFHGSQDSRRVILTHDWRLSEPIETAKGGKYRYKFQVVLTTYEMIVAHPEPLRRVKWAAMVVDEGHRLKNRNSRAIDELRLLRAKRKLVLTGTPLQNHVTELWTILNFIEPKKFDDLDSFLDEYGALSSGGGTVGQVRMLSKLLRPHLLRREKADVETLQPMQETTIQIEITNLQKVCYRAVLEHNRGLLQRGAALVQGGAGAGNANMLAGSFANVSMMLRHCCNHPWLIKEVEEGALANLEVESSVRPPRTEREFNDPVYWHQQLESMRKADMNRYFDRLVHSSGKMVLLDKLLPKLKREGHRVLLFSQFTKLLDLIEDLIDARGWGYERLDGTVGKNERQQAIDRFSDPTSSSFLFLLSTRAGGVGINLTAADTVIIFDSDWNPQNDIQAMARCHRIGQQKVVQVYKLCTKDTYETVMLQAANHKLGLEHAVIKQGGYDQAFGSKEPGSSSADDTSMTGRERASMIERLLRVGAQVLHNAEHDQAATKFGESSIEDILTHYAETKTVDVNLKPGEGKKEDGGGGSSSFALTSFISETSGEAIDLDDPSFWTKMLPDVGADLDEETAKKMDAAAAKSGASGLTRAAPKEYVDNLKEAMQQGKEQAAERKRAREEGGGDEEEEEEEEEEVKPTPKESKRKKVEEPTNRSRMRRDGQRRSLMLWRR